MTTTAPDAFWETQTTLSVQNLTPSDCLCVTSSHTHATHRPRSPAGLKLTCRSSHSDARLGRLCLVSAGGQWVTPLVMWCPNRSQTTGQQAWRQLSRYIGFWQWMLHCVEKTICLESWDIHNTHSSLCFCLWIPSFLSDREKQSVAFLSACIKGIVRIIWWRVAWVTCKSILIYSWGIN